MTATGTVLVTGVEGMIGYAVAARLLRAGRQVVGMDLHIRSATDLDVPVVAADLSDVHALYGTLVRHGVSAIVHCGAISGPMLARDDPHGLLRTNVVGTLNILEATRRLGLRRLVFCSSLAVYGRNDGSVLHEDAPLLAIDTYGASKIAAEALVSAYITQHEVPAVSARLAWVYGPRRRTSCAIRTMLQDAMAGRATYLAGRSSAMRQYVHAEDVASALLALLDADGLERDVYNVSGNDYRSLTQVAGIVRDLFPEADITIGEVDDPTDPPMGPLSTAALTQDTGWTPAISLDQGVADYRDWLAAERDPG